MEGKAQIAELSFMTQDPDMHPVLALRTGAAVNSGGYSNPKVDALIDQGRAESDPPSAPRSTGRCRRSSSDDAPWVFIANWKQNAVSSAR